MKTMIKSLFIGLALAITAANEPLLANSRLKSLGLTMRRNKTVTGLAVAGIGAFIAHKTLTYCHAQELARSQAELAKLQETELIKKTEEFVDKLKRGGDDIISKADRKFLYYQISIRVGLVDTNKEITEDLVAEKFIDYKGVNDGHFKDKPDFDYTQEGLDLKAVSENFFKKITALDVEIATTEQVYGKDHAETIKKKREYLNATQAFARLIVKYLNCCRYRQQEVQTYFQAMTDPKTVAMDISKKTDFYHEQNATLWRYVDTTNNAGGLPPYGPLLLDLSQPLRELVSFVNRHRTLQMKIANLQATGPYPLWCKHFWPTK